MDFNKIKRSFRKQLPPEHPYDAGPAYGSRVYEASPEVIPVVTFTLLLLSAVLFLLTDILPEKPMTIGQHNEILNNLGFRDNFNIIIQSPWALLSTTVFHGSMMHILMNGMAMVTLGSAIERGLGSLKTLILYLAFAIVSSGYQLLVTDFMLIQQPIEHFFSSIHLTGNIGLGGSLGLSGILFAVVGFMWGSWKRWTGFLSVFNLKMLKFVFAWQAFCFVMPYLGMQRIANTAHISGFIFGFLVGMWMCYGIKNAKIWFIASILMFAIIPIGWFILHQHFSELFAPYIEQLRSNGYLEEY